VFFRLRQTHEVVGYGETGMILDSFKKDQWSVIFADKDLLGGLLYTFYINFKNSADCFFSIFSKYLSASLLKDFREDSFYERFNLLSK